MHEVKGRTGTSGDDKLLALNSRRLWQPASIVRPLPEVQKGNWFSPAGGKKF